GEEAAASAHKSAGNRLKEGELPEDLPEIELSSPEDMPVASVLNKAGLVKNAAAARDLLGAGSVKVDGQVVDRTFMLALGETRVFQAGKKAFARITLKAE
ncbi:S4 domain-containing protein, partial [Pseudomonas aeruginosa]